MDLLRSAKDSVRNPLGIIALFISLIYGVANLLLGTTADKLTLYERVPIICFIIIFPFVVLTAFYLLVTRHHFKLYAPADFRNDKAFLRAASPQEVEHKLAEELVSINEAEASDAAKSVTQEIVPDGINDGEVSEPKVEYAHSLAIGKLSPGVLESIVDTAINSVASEIRGVVSRKVAIIDGPLFDAYIEHADGAGTFVEVRYLATHSSTANALPPVKNDIRSAIECLGNKFKLVLVIVVAEESNMLTIKQLWKYSLQDFGGTVTLKFMLASHLIRIARFTG